MKHKVEISRLHESAVLVDLTIHSPVTARTDKRVTESVESLHKLNNGGRWVKSLYDPNAFKELRSVDFELREHFSNSTLPFRKGCENIITGDILPTFLEQHRKLVLKREKITDQLVSQFDQLIEDARKRLNGTWRAEDYPATKEQFRSQFEVELDTLPLPRIDDLKDPILRKNAERAVESRINSAQQALVHRLAESLKRLGDTLQDGEKVFRNSTITQARTALVNAEALNLGGDPEIAKAVSSARAGLEKYLEAGKEDELRDQPAVRELVASTATKAVRDFEAIAQSLAGLSK